MPSFLFALLTTAANPSGGSGGTLNSTSVIVALVTAMATLGAAYMMFRGKTQDTANWLIEELRNDALAARQSATECETHRREDREVMDNLRGNILSLELGLRNLQRQEQLLKVELSELRRTVHEKHPDVPA